MTGSAPLLEEGFGIDHVFADGRCLPGEVGAGGVDLVQLRPVVVTPRQQQRHAKRPNAARFCGAMSRTSIRTRLKSCLPQLLAAIPLPLL